MSGGVSGETGINIFCFCEPGSETFPLNHWTVASGHALVLHKNPTLYQLDMLILGASISDK